MSATGWSVLPVTVSLKGVQSALSKGLSGPLTSSGKKAAKTLESAMKEGAENGVKAVEVAQKRAEKATLNVATAEKKVQDAKGQTEVAVKKVEAAELALETARSKGGSQVEQAEKKLKDLRESGKATAEQLKAAEDKLDQARSSAGSTVASKEAAVMSARQRSEKAADQLKSAEDNLVTAHRKAEDAADNVKAATKRMGDGMEDAESGAKGLKGKLEELVGSSEGVGKGFDSIKGKLGLLTGAAGIGGIGAAFATGMDITQATDKMNRQLGLTGNAAKAASAEVRDVMKTGIAGGVDEATGAIGALNGQFKYLGFEGEQTAAQLADNFIAFSETFGVSIEEATQTAGQLIQNGLAGDVEEAADLMTAAMQRVPQAMQGELPEIINEYGTNFRALGFDGEEAFGLLVAASEKGKWALDKTGDSLKEFTIRGSDMSESSKTAFESVGLNAEEMANKIAQGGEGARDALKQTADGLLQMEDPAERANAAIALFGTPLEDLSVDQIPDFLESLSQGAGGMADFQGSSQEMADQMKNSLEGRMNSLKGTVQSLAGDAFMKLWDALEPIAKWASENKDWLTPIAVSIGVFAGAVAVASGAMAVFNAVMAVNPFVLIGVAIAALVAGLVWFFKKTELGQKIWKGFVNVLKGVWSWIKGVFGPVFSWLGDVISDVWQGIKDGWDILWEGIKTAWESVLKPVFETLWTIVSTTLGVIATVILAPLMIAWNVLSEGIKWAWENLIKPAWDAISVAAQWMWDNVLSPVFSWISEKWQAISDGIKWYWENVTKPAWDALCQAAQWMWDNVLSPVFNFIKTAWEALGNGIRWVYDTIIKPAWDAVASALQWLWDNIVNPIVTWIKDKWTEMGDGIRHVWDTYIKPAFDALKDGVSGVRDFFSDAVDGIKSVWDSLKSALAKPINFMINTVYNDGILKAWNKVADFIPGLDPASPLSGIPEHATGGAIRGPGHGTSDDVLMWGSNGEHMLTAEEVRKLGGQGAVYRMREMIDRGETFTVGDGGLFVSSTSKRNNGPMNPVLPAFKNGGEIRPAWEAKLERGHEWARSQNGKPYLTGSQWPAGGDCSGFMSAIASVILGGDPNSGHWATPAFPASQAASVSAAGQAWEAGLSQGFSIGMTGGPQSGGAMGHTAGTLSAVGGFSSVNVESGGSHGNVAYGGPAAGADDGQWRSGNYHLAIGADGDFEAAGGPSPEQKQGFLRDKIKDIFDSILDPIDGMFASAVGTPPPEWFDIPPKAMHSSVDKTIDWLFDRVNDLGGLLGSAYDKAKDVVGGAVSGVTGLFRDQGGYIPNGMSIVRNETGKPEAVLNWKQLELVQKLMESAGSNVEAQDVVNRVAADTEGAAPVVEVGSSNEETAAQVATPTDSGADSTPSTWSSIAGDFAKNWTEGMVQDALGVFGISDTLPPIFQAANQYYAVDEKGEGAGAVNAQIADAASDSTVATTDAKPASTVENVPEVKVGAVKKGEYKKGAAFFWEEIAKAASERRLGFAAAKIAGATALVESGDPLRMWASSVDTASQQYPYDSIGSDSDSSGLFQQRNNGGWGTVDQRMNARASAGMFLNAMVKKFPGWRTMEPGAVAQGVQVSAFPSKYATKMGAAEKALAKFKGKLPSFSTGTSRVVGGSARGVDDVLSLLAQDEAVLTAEAADVLGRDTIAAINSNPQAFVRPTTQVATAPAVNGGGKGDTFIFQAVNTDELSTQYRRAAAGRVRGAIGAR